MAEGKVIEGSPMGKKDDGLGRYLLFLVIIFAALWALNNYYSSLADNERYIAEQVDMLLAKNPNMAKQDATDKVMYDIAIQEKNKALCGRLQSGYLASRCLKYFIINGIE